MVWERVVVQNGEEVLAQGDELINDGLSWNTRGSKISRAAALAWLDAKRTSAQEKGWTVVELTDGFDAVKSYAEGPVAKKERRLSIREVV